MQPLLHGAAAVATLTLSLLILLNARGRGSMPALLLCLSLFVWTAGEWASRLSVEAPWREPFYIALAGGAMAPAFFFHFVASVVQTAGTRRMLFIFYTACGLLAASAPIALAWPAMNEFVAGSVWNWVYICMMLPLFGGALYMLTRGAIEEPHAGRRRALRWVLAAGIAGFLGGMLDVTAVPFGHDLRLGALGAIACAALFAIATIRERFLGVTISLRRMVAFGLLAAVGLALVVAAGVIWRERWDLLTAVGLFTVLFVLAGFQRVIWDWREEVETLRRLAALGEMAAGVAHEVRNPLSAIRGATQLMEGDVDPQKRAEYLEIIRSEIDALNRVVEEFQQFSRPLELRFQPVELGVYLDRLVDLFRAGLPAGVQVVVEKNESVPPVPADPDALRHALWNLMKNGVEAMENGGTLRVRVRPFATHVCIEVLDEGSGIPPEDLERIFEPFRSRKRRGTGLGLAISHRLLQAHGGRLSAENRPEGGARMLAWLPRGA